MPRFQLDNIDIIGTLPTSGGNRCCLTFIDRFSRPPVAIPISDITAGTIAFPFIIGWVGHYGTPLKITTN